MEALFDEKQWIQMVIVTFYLNLKNQVGLILYKFFQNIDNGREVVKLLRKLMCPRCLGCHIGLYMCSLPRSNWSRKWIGKDVEYSFAFYLANPVQDHVSQQNLCEDAQKLLVWNLNLRKHKKLTKDQFLSWL